MTAPTGATSTLTLAAPFRGVRAAFVFLTRIPVGGFPYSPEDFRWAPAHFPLVGTCIGGAGAAVVYLALPLGSGVASALALTATVALTGAFHEDGLADTFDALGGAHTSGRILEILKDSRIGAFGGLALASTLLLRAALLVELGAVAPVALVASQAVSRMPPIWLMALLPYATDDARARSRQINRAGPAQAAVATLWAGGVLVALVAVGALTAGTAIGTLGAAFAVAPLCGWRFHRRVGGVTGDFLGATQQVAEAAILAVVLIASR
jgi:adenosylcobinamide-GDP ribazoletransferase